MKIRLLAGVAAVALCAATGASAQSALSGWYLAGDVGYHSTDGINAKSSVNNSAGSPYAWTFSTDEDWAGFGRVGYRFTPNWRVEAEYGYRKGDIEGVRGSASAAQPIGLCTAGPIRTIAAPNCGAPNGEMKATTLMANVIYDFMPDSTIRPFLGAGLGTAWIHNKVYGQLSGVPAFNAPYQNVSFDDVDQAFAYQGLAGVAWEVAPNWSIDLTGRYLATNDAKWGSVTRNVGPGVGTITNVGSFSGKYKDTSITLGVRYTFGSPPPPAAPAYEAREFVVYFPFDQYVLTPEAQTVVSQAAEYAKGGNATKITVVGHTDKSGSDKYNARLSERRAKAVADGLVSQGVAATTLAVDWKGETAPAVDTADGVKEPLNRRSTISINF